MQTDIFIVDDDGQILSLLRDIFEIEGWSVTATSNITEAKAKLATSQPDCFIIDLKLPDGDGNELIQYLHSKHKAPIIAISGATTGHDAFNLPATVQMGADYHLSKPFEPDELIIECKRLIKVNRSL